MMAALLQSCDNGLSSSHFGWSGRFGVHPSGCPRPHGIIRHSSHPSHSSHNEQAKCYRTWQGRITFWGRRKLRPAILWYSLLLVSGCSRTGSIEVTWKNCCHARLGESTQLRLTVSPVRRHNRSDVTVIGKGLQGRLGHGVGCVLILRGFPACNLGPGCGGCQREASHAG